MSESTRHVTIGKTNVNPGLRIMMSPGSLPGNRERNGQRIPAARSRTPRTINVVLMD
jgi:hypothetical protein